MRRRSPAAASPSPAHPAPPRSRRRTGRAFPFPGLFFAIPLACSIAASPAEHPRLLFTSDQLPAIRLRTHDGIGAKAWAILERNAIDRQGARVPEYRLKGALTGRTLQKDLLTLAFHGLVSGDRASIDAGLGLLRQACALATPPVVYAGNGVLAVGDTAFALAFAFDWLAPSMDGELEARARSALETFGAWLYEHSLASATNTDASSQWGRDEEERLSHNWNAVAHGPLGLCALALGGHAPWLALAEKRVRGYLRASHDATGAFHEGIHYMSYGLHNAVPFCEALRFAGCGDLLGVNPGTPRVPAYVAWHVLPTGRRTVPINACYGLPKPADGLFDFIMRFKDSEGLWAFDRLFGDSGDATWGDESNTSYSIGLPFLILWEDKSLRPRPPAAGEPSRLFQRGQACARDGWGERDSLVTFTSGNGIEGNWNHGDRNGFTFYSRGEAFAIERGYGRSKTREHSAVLIDGRGQSDGKGHAVPGTLLSCTDEEGIFTVCGDATEAYTRCCPVERAQRTVVFVRGAQPFLVVWDDLRKDGRPHLYEWLLQTATNNLIRLDAEGAGATLQGGARGARCRLDFFAPSPVRLEVLADPVTKRPDTLSASVHADEPRILAVLTALDAGEEAPALSLEGGRCLVLRERDGRTTRAGLVGGRLVVTRAARASSSFDDMHFASKREAKPFPAPAWKNFALGAAVRASSADPSNPIYAPSNAVDGRADAASWSHWANDETADPVGVSGRTWLMLEWAEPHPVQKFVLTFKEGYEARAFHLESREKGSWVPIPGSRVEGNRSFVRELGFDVPLVTDAIRFVPESGSPRQPQTARLVEIEVLGN